MPNDMGSFRTRVEVANPGQSERRHVFHEVLVDTGSELSWFPADTLESIGIQRRTLRRFRQASGTTLSRWSGTADVTVAGVTTGDEVVFGEPADLILLGARTLEGLNLCVDPVRKILIDTGPAPVAVA